MNFIIEIYALLNRVFKSKFAIFRDFTRYIYPTLSHLHAIPAIAEEILQLVVCTLKFAMH